MPFITDTVSVEIEVTPEKLLEAYDSMSPEEQTETLEGLREHFEEYHELPRDAQLELETCRIAEASNLSSYDYQNVNRYLARYGFKLVRAI